MIKKFISLLLLFVLWYINISFAVVHDTDNDSDMVADFVIKRRISPFEMSSISFERISFDFRVVEEATGNSIFKKNAKHTLYLIDIEKPMYKKYISYGLTWGPGVGVKPFTGFSFDTILYVKLKAPFYLGNIGDVSLFVTGGIGISNIMYMYSGTNPLNTELGSIVATQVDSWSKPMELRRGFAKVLKYGVEYYPIQWLGIGLGMQIRAYNYAQSQFVKEKNILTSSLFMEKFSFTTKSSFFISFKTTF
ncbi:MAG: hypothetical protein HRT87_09035 [Legionellales bacterium]|nr:hypothetical protein [Legionellales bacterium]